MGLTLLLGGARSGKSALAVGIGRGWRSPVTFVATARPGDADMAARVARHREERPPHWRCLEEPVDLAGAIHRTGGNLIVDCLTVWVANAMAALAPGDVLELARSTAALAARRQARTLVVSNEVGLGVHPATAAGREFRDTLGRVNAIWAEAAERVLFVVAGRALELRPVLLQVEDEGDG